MVRFQWVGYVRNSGARQPQVDASAADGDAVQVTKRGKIFGRGVGEVNEGGEVVA